MKLPKYPLSSGDKLITFYLYYMKIIQEIKKRKIPIVRIEKSLNNYDNIVLFPDKLEKANKILKTAGLPKQWITK